MSARFAELVAATNFSFLRGASHPSDMVARAIELGMTGIGIADRNTVAGVVRAHVALKQAQEKFGEIDFKLIVGARLVFADGTPDIIAYPATRHGWGRLTRLLSRGNLRSEKGGCILHLADLLEFLDDLLLIVMPHASPNEQRPRRNKILYDGLDIEGRGDVDGGGVRSGRGLLRRELGRRAGAQEQGDAGAEHGGRAGGHPAPGQGGAMAEGHGDFLGSGNADGGEGGVKRQGPAARAGPYRVAELSSESSAGVD